MVSTGLRDAGYEYVNSDDWYGKLYQTPAPYILAYVSVRSLTCWSLCSWMVSCRNPALVNKVCDKAVDCCDNYTGPQIPNPIKFPQGIPPVVDYIHSKGLKAGLYTSASPWTCAGFAASCEFEDIDEYGDDKRNPNKRCSTQYNPAGKYNMPSGKSVGE